MKRVGFLRSTAELLSGALKSTSSNAVVFLAEAMCSPGIDNQEDFGLLVTKMYDQLVEVGIPVVKRAHGVVLANDGIHWSITSTVAIESLIERLVARADRTEFFQKGQNPDLWHWLYNSTDCCHYPTCTICKNRLCDAHL